MRETAGLTRARDSWANARAAARLLVLLGAVAVAPPAAAEDSEPPPAEEPDAPPAETPPAETPPAETPPAEAPAAAKATVAAPADDDSAPLTTAERFEGTSILVEHAFSVGHGANLSPAATRTVEQAWTFTLSVLAARWLEFDASLSTLQELTTTDTTLAHELLVDDLAVGASADGPVPDAIEDWLSWWGSLEVALPTSKASRAETLIAELSPSLGVTGTLPALDGLSFSYGITATPRFHRFTTSSTLTPYPCSRATGCSQGLTNDTGSRNVAFQLGHDFGVALAALDSRLSVSADLGLVYNRPYALAESERLPEELVHNPDNDGGSPTSLTTSFTFDVGFLFHPGLGLSVGLWTPGGMRPDGAYYNPIVNRYSGVYVDVTLYPVALVNAEVQRAKRKKASAL